MSERFENPMETRHRARVEGPPPETGESPEAHSRSRPQGKGGGAAGGRSIFAAMPFDVAFDDVYFVAMRKAASAVGATCVRVDHLLHGGDAVEETQREIRTSVAVVADVSTAAPDVLYELGYAHAIGKPSVQICSTPFAELPFSIRNRDTLLYTPGRTHLLARDLAGYLTVLLDR
jgi:hypothetical protein